MLGVLSLLDYGEGGIEGCPYCKRGEVVAGVDAEERRHRGQEARRRALQRTDRQEGSRDSFFGELEL